MTSCAKLVSWPWPLFIVPSTSSTRPSGATVTSARSRGNAAGDLDVIADADAAQLAALLRIGLARGKAFPIGETQRRVQPLLVFAIVVGLADAVGVGEGVRRDEVLAPQLGRIEAALIGGDIDEPLDAHRRLRAGRRCDRAWSAGCW